MILFFKAHVPAHERHAADGRTVHVNAYDTHAAPAAPAPSADPADVALRDMLARGVRQLRPAATAHLGLAGPSAPREVMMGHLQRIFGFTAEQAQKVAAPIYKRNPASTANEVLFQAHLYAKRRADGMAADAAAAAQRAKEQAEAPAREAARQEQMRRAKDDAALVPAAGARMGWSAADAKEVGTMLALGIPAEEAAAKATLSAVAREAKRLGWVIRHTSNDRSGEASSHYITVPGLGEARVSDHAIPDTAVRFDRDMTGGRTRWNGEVVIGRGEWRTLDLATMMQRLREAAA